MNFLILLAAASLEVGGDALIRWGLKERQWIGFVLGALVLFAYGIVVNTPKWDFGRLLGVYISLFFVVSQLVSYFIFHERIRTPLIVGGVFILIGGLVMTFWHDEPQPPPPAIESKQ